MTNSSDGIGPKDNTERESQEKGFAAIKELIDGAHRIAICAHTSPDGDALGSVLALAGIIRAGWEGKQVDCLLADDAPVPRIYEFLPGAGDMVRACNYEATPDLFIALDLPTIDRLNQAAEVCRRSHKIAVMDHHPSREPFGDASVVRPDAAAAGVIVTEFALWLGIDIDPDMAQNLLCAIITDTGRFQYQNADDEVFCVASHLVEHGASPSEVSLNVYQSFRVQYLHLKSLVLGRIKTFENGRIAYSYATQADLDRTGADLDECDGLIDVVRSVEGCEVAFFLKTVPGGKVRGNLRSKGELDVSGVARLMGGGGHKAAAGFTSNTDIDETLAAVLPHLRALVRQKEEH